MSNILVTGASRGIGRGIAIELALAGHKVYITGRSLKSLQKVDADFQELKQARTPKTGQIIPLECDHGNDQQVDDLFKNKIAKLDVLINNAYAGVNFITENSEKPFHEIDINAWDIINNVGLRNHYRCSHHAANNMVKNGRNLPSNPGLIITVSSGGGATRLFNTAYGVGKEAKDRMMSEMAYDLRKQNIYAISLWPGAVKTETIQAMLDNQDVAASQRMINVFKNGESTRFSGRCLAKLVEQSTLTNRAYMKSINGGVVQTADLGQKFGLVDVDNRVIPSMLQVKTLLSMAGKDSIARFVPSWVRIPKWVFVMKNFGRRYK